MSVQRKPPAKRLYRPGLGGVGVIDAALDEKNQDEQKAREQDLALAKAEIQIDLQLTGVVKSPLTNAQRQALLRKRRAQAKLNAKRAVHRNANEKETAAAIEKATDDAFEAALKELHELNSKEGFSQEEWTEKVSELTEAFYPTPKSDKVPSMSQGTAMTGAPRGFGRLITDGYNSTQLEKVQGGSVRDHGGVEPWNGEGRQTKVKPEGNSIDKDKQGQLITSSKKDGTLKVTVKGSEQNKKFNVRLGEDYKLTKKQQALEKLISKHKVLLASLQKMEDSTRWRSNDPEAKRRAIVEDTRLKLDFLDRVAAGLIPTEIADRVVPLITRDLEARETVVTA